MTFDHNAGLRDADPLVAHLIDRELGRQRHGLELIASENFASRAVIDAMGIHREAVVIPLGTGKGRVRRLPSGKLEIVVDADAPFDEWLGGLPDLIKAAQTT